MEKISIGYFADGPWSHKAFEKIIKDKTIEVKFIVPRTDSTDNTLLNYANKYDIPYHKGIKVNSDEFYELASSYNCDLMRSIISRGLSRGHALIHRGEIRRIFHRDLTISLSLPV